MADSHETATVRPDIPARFVSPFARRYLEGTGFSCEGEEDLYFYAEQGVGKFEDSGQGEGLTIDDARKAAEAGCPVAALVAEMSGISDQDDGKTLISDLSECCRLPSWPEAFQAIIKAAGMPELVVEGATWCDKARPGEFGGWVALIEPERIQMGDTASLLQMLRSNVTTVFKIKAGSREEADEIYYNDPPEPVSETVGPRVRHMDESLEVDGPEEPDGDDDIENLRDALGRIAKGESHSGAMAREYENIASAALTDHGGGKALRTALEQIANGNSYYGPTASEYKEIARSALNKVDEPCDEPGEPDDGDPYGDFCP